MTSGEEDAVDDPAKAAMTGDQDAGGFVDPVGLAVGDVFEAGTDDTVPQHEERGRQHHRQRHHQGQPRRERFGHDAVGQGKGDEDVAEFARLGESERHEPALRAPQP